MKLVEDSSVEKVFNTYPLPYQQKLLYLRQLIISTASEIPSIDVLEETLKWGEPSYISKIGSTVRIAWQDK